MAQQETIVGEVANVIYSNDENGYKILEIENDDDCFTAVGYFHSVSEGEVLKLTGRWVTHHTYGEQFKTEIFEKKAPATRAAIMRYLSSGIIRGIRKSTAEKLVEKFGDDTLNVMEKEPQKLAIIRGISLDKAMKMHESYMNQLGSTALVMFLQNCGISVKTSAKIYKKFGTAAVDVIKGNPYILCEAVDGIGFKTADEIAKKLDYDKDSSNRIRAGTLYTLKYNTQFGHCYLPRTVLVRLSSNLLSVGEDAADFAIDALLFDGVLTSENYKDEDRIYYHTHFLCEAYSAKKLCELNKYKYAFNRDEILKQLDIIEKMSKISFADMQREAVVSAMMNSVLVITGGPGTGKTTIINAIIDIMHSNGLSVILAAPTGRAAKRMSQVCSLEAKTIHRLLEAGYYGSDDEMEFMVNEEAPIDADVIIIDEMSMVDIVLLNNLLKAIRPGTRLIMVGDVNQLPSVGPGNVLRDIIESGVIEVIRLTEIFRQASESMIVTNAHGIYNGKYPVCNLKGKDFFFADFSDASAGVEYILSLCSSRLPKAYGFSPFDIQVLSPAKKGIAGVYNLNQKLREIINSKNKNKREHDFGFQLFREGDKVMQTKNNYDIKWSNISGGEGGNGVFNGDVGVITDINEGLHTVTVVYDDKKVVYDFKDIDEIELAYCITIHKSQGSEFPVVIMPMYEAPYMLMNRNLLYTGVTRAKNLVVLVGKEQIVRAMTDNNREDRRYSGLKNKLAERNEKNDIF